MKQCLYRGAGMLHATAKYHVNNMVITVSRDNHIRERDWNNQPLFGSRRRSYLRWLLLLLLIGCGVLLFLYPSLVAAILETLGTTV